VHARTEGASMHACVAWMRAVQTMLEETRTHR